MAELTMALEEGPSKGRIVARLPGSDAEAEITFSRAGESSVIVDHTGVPDEFRGQGVGRALSQRMVEVAREKKWTVIPLCPFFKAELQKHPEWRDVL